MHHEVKNRARNHSDSNNRENEHLLSRLTQVATDAIVMLNDSGIVTFCNLAAERMLDYTFAEMSGVNFHKLFTPAHLVDDAAKGFAQFRDNGLGPLFGKTTEAPVLRRDGSEYMMEFSLSAINYHGAWHALGIMRDISERKRLQAEVQDARNYAENIVETVREPLVVLNSDLVIISANHSFYDTFRVSPEETIGNFIYDLGNRQWDIPRLRVLLEEILPNDTVINGYEVEHDFPDIGSKTILLNARQIFRETVGSHIILLAMEDITERKQLEKVLEKCNQKFEKMSATDGLTQIANRRHFDEALAHEYSRHARSGAELSLIMLDIDYFKAFNDNYGHICGDECLRQIAQVLTDCTGRPADLVARYGGEEFVCILPETDRNGAVAIAEKILHGIRSSAIPHKASSMAEYVTASLGVATVRCTVDGSGLDIVAQADRLLYQAKSCGRNRLESNYSRHLKSS